MSADLACVVVDAHFLLTLSAHFEAALAALSSLILLLASLFRKRYLDQNQLTSLPGGLFDRLATLNNL